MLSIWNAASRITPTSQRSIRPALNRTNWAAYSNSMLLLATTQRCITLFVSQLLVASFVASQSVQNIPGVGDPSGNGGITNGLSQVSIADNTVNMLDRLKQVMADDGVSADESGQQAMQNILSNRAGQAQTSIILKQAVAKAESAAAVHRDTDSESVAQEIAWEKQQRAQLYDTRKLKPATEVLRAKEEIAQKEEPTNGSPTMFRAPVRSIQQPLPTPRTSKSPPAYKKSDVDIDGEETEFENIEARLKKAEKLT